VQEFSGQFADLLEPSGLALLPILTRLAEQQPNPDFQQILFQVRDDVNGGWPVPSAMERHARVFSAQYTSAIREGETTGTLDLALRRLGSRK
jgi:type II secretory pathway component PulF